MYVLRFSTYEELLNCFVGPPFANQQNWKMGSKDQPMASEIDRKEFPYPEGTPGQSNSGKYWHQLSESSQAALDAVERWIYQDNISLDQLGTCDLHHSLLILRYLRANQFNVSKTIAHIQKNIEWRKTMNMAELIAETPEKILGCSLEELTGVFPHWHSGYDKTGRPVLFKQYGKFDAGKVKKLVGGKDFNPVVRYHLWEQEACGRLCLAQSLKDQKIVETISAVIDIKDMGMSQITSDFMKLTKALAEIDQNQYPETLGRAFIINAPSAFPLVWRMVKPWLDPATVAKITVLGGPKEHIPVLQEFIGEENLPSNYGGTLPPLSPQVHPYAETMLSYPSPVVETEAAEEEKETEEPFNPAVLDYAYPVSTPGSLPSNGKYWLELSPASKEALVAVEQWVAKEKVDVRKLSTADLHPALLLLRYLRANQFNAAKTIVHLQKNLEWRKTKDIDTLITQSPEEILGCTMEELTNVFPHWHSGYDKTGRPVLFKQYGKFDAGQVKKLVGGNFDNVVRYHLWEQEACGRLCLQQAKKMHAVVETISAVIDIKDMGMSQITSDFLKLTKALAEIDQNQYPETLGRAFIINAPSAFPLVWRMVKPWLDPATVAKITVLGGPKEHIPVLQEFIGEENLPSNYGGTLPPLSPQVHPYAETMLSYPSPVVETEAAEEEKETEEPFDPAVLDYAYPVSTPGSLPSNGKYWLELSPASKEALVAVEQWVAKEKVDVRKLSTADLHPALLLLRYLRANQFNAAKTIVHLQKNLEWRKTKDIDTLITQSPEEILGCTMEELTNVFPHWHSGYDKTGRPVLFKQYGKFDAGQVKKLVGGNFDNVVRYHLWEQEACGRLCLQQAKKTHAVVETISAVIDIKDMGMSQITSDFLKLTKALAEIDQNQYPETLGRAFIINAPSAFPLVWRMVKPWLDPATVAKITVLGGPKEHIPVLQEFIGEENLPSNYGGTLPPLSPQVHPYAETMLSLPTRARSVEAVQKQESEPFDPAVLEYSYPDGSTGATPGSGKYWMQLTPASQEALSAVEAWVKKEKFDLKKLGTADLHPALMLLRYLRANQFNAAKTIVHLQKNLEWRKVKDIDAVISQSPEAILGCSLEELTSVFPHWHSGYDKTGRPVLFKQYGKFNAGQVKSLVGGNFEPVVRYHLWEQEACGRLCLAQSRKLKKVIETISAVIDIKDMGMSQITRDFLSLTKLLAEIDQNQYPETLGRAFIINAPSAFPLVWRMVKPWLDPATVAKITVLGGPKEHIPVLQEFIGEENLPSNYGGTLPPLSPQVHPYAETMLSYGDPATRVDEDARAAYARVNDRNSFRHSARRKSLQKRPTESAEPAEQVSSLWFYPSLVWNGLQRNWFESSPEDDNESEWEGGSERSDSSEELHFADAFESQSDLETNSHSHLYSAKPIEGTSTKTPKKRKRSFWRRFFLFKAMSKCYRAAVFDKTLRALTIQRLEMRFMMGAAVHLLCAIACAAISATALAKIQWSSSGARLQLWAYTVVLLVSCFMIIFDFVGYYGTQSKNWPMMVMYSVGTTVGTLIFAAVTIAGFLYYSLPESTGVGAASLNSTLAENRNFMITLSIGCLFVTLCAAVPLILGRGVYMKLRELQGKHLQTRQIQSVLKIAQSISTIGAIAMLGYGGVGITYLLRIKFDAALFPIFGLIYGGVSVVITSSIGVWVANTVHRSVLRLYQYVILPFILALLLIVALLCYDGLYNAEAEVHDSYADLNTTDSEEKIKSTVQTLLLVSGTLTIFICVFQTISLIATRALSSTIDSSGQVKEKVAILQAIKEKELGVYTTNGLVSGAESQNKDSFWADFSVEHLGRLYMLYSRNQRDRFLIAWSVFSGIFNIFVNGTLAVFARNAARTDSDNDSWMLSLLRLLGRADTRFIISNAYLRSSETLLALIIGPLLLFYAWSTFVYAPYRHVLGITVSLSQILIWVLYFTIEIYAGMKHFQGRQSPVILFFLIALGVIGYVIIPGWILYKELAASVNDTSTSDSHELLMEANDETKPFLNKFEFDNLESGTYYDNGTPGRRSGQGKRPPRTSESSLEQMLGMGTGSRKAAVSPEPLGSDDASISTRSFILSLGAETSDASTELELYRARAASAFRSPDPALRPSAVPTPLYAEKYTPKSAGADAGLGTPAADEKKEEEQEAPSLPMPPPFPTSPLNRGVSPTRLRNGSESFERQPTIPEESRLSLYEPSAQKFGAVSMSPAVMSSTDRMTSFLRKRSAAPLKPRTTTTDHVHSMNRSLAGGINQVAAATAALDPNKVLPMLMNMGVSSVEAAGMMTYLMRMKELGDGKKKKKNSLAMVV